MTARLRSVIETTLARAGNGTAESPSRVLTQYWSENGELLAEVDPVADAVMRRAIALAEERGRREERERIAAKLDELHDAALEMPLAFGKGRRPGSRLTVCWALREVASWLAGKNDAPVVRGDS